MENEMTEKDGQLDDRQTWKSPTRTNVTTSIGRDVWELAKKQNISWNDALEFGIRFLVAEKDSGLGGYEYPKTELQTKLHRFVKKFQDELLRNNELEDRIEKLTAEKKTVEEFNDEREKDIDEIFGGIKDE